ncbi:ABC transporter ATP-binding protein [Halobacterium sp. KA-4]|uniref:ABC transporter ATP-binding protein n=1 Tax=Halobacterium sp. KA-4 TaxID=2896367 RepID=UPI001E36BC80|nr:ABC transporter ATP-binding protein [Halobacterium sp. KA-4]MCD2201459.1 ABC transporter ATP-binding protein [Halobacterium sp. KA-4]
MASVHVDNLRKEFGSIVAVNSVSLELEDGELVVFVGPSGCGKTTLLRMIAGLETPTSGDIRFGSKSVVDSPPQNREISMVFQDLALYPHLTAMGNIKFALNADSSIPESEYAERIEEVANLANCDEFLEKPVNDLSGGQQQRVAIARALVREPEVFLLDEPLSDLDELMKREIRSSIERLQNDLDITTIHVTHDQEEAMMMADKIVVLNGGDIGQVGTPSEIFNNPSSLFVANFIGSPQINILQCVITDETDEIVTLTSDFGTFTLSNSVSVLADRSSNDVAVGIRPQHLDWYDEEPAEFNVTIPVTVQVIEQMGTEDIIRCITPDHEEIVAVVPTGILTEGQDGYLTTEETYLHFFDGYDDSAVRLN